MEGLCCCPIKSLKCVYSSVAVTAVQVPKKSDLVIQCSEGRIVKLSHLFISAAVEAIPICSRFFLCSKVHFDCWSAFP